MRSLLAHYALAGTNAGAVDEAVERAEVLLRGCDCRLSIGLFSDIGLAEYGARLKVSREFLSCLDVHIGDDKARTGGAKTPHGRLTKAGAAAGDDESRSVQLHKCLSLVRRPFSCRCRSASMRRFRRGS